MQARRKLGGWGAVAPQFLAKQLTLSQPGGGADYAHHSNPSRPGFSDLATALKCTYLLVQCLIPTCNSILHVLSRVEKVTVTA